MLDPLPPPQPGASHMEEEDDDEELTPRFNLYGDTKIREDLAVPLVHG